MKKNTKKPSKTNQAQRERRQLDVGELADIYGGARARDEGTKGGDSR